MTTVVNLSTASRPAPATGETLLDVRNLEKYFPIRGGLLSRVVANVKAVNDVSFQLGRGEVVGHLRRRQHPVRQSGQQGELLAPRRGAAGRHHRARVPVQHGLRLAEGGDAGEAGGQAGVCGHRGFSGGVFTVLWTKMPNIASSVAARPNQVRA